MATAGVTNPAPGMQHWPLLIPKILDHAAAIYPRRAIVGADGEGGLDRSDWATLNRRARQVARAFEALGVKRGDRVATLAWNSIRHLECWYGANGLGAVLHTINPRLFSEQIQFIANHAGDHRCSGEHDDHDIAELVDQHPPRGPALRFDEPIQAVDCLSFTHSGRAKSMCWNDIESRRNDISVEPMPCIEGVG